ncbi:dTDP-4-dehydrorhamnose reductase [Acidihalobacter yilgarnensis]|uniref:dTDP-4-dehydrorhamnose reductase n=1 Tax=Acidihalobacter yilgarnensis TaxID=2819280 RepID=A0A1D8IQ85_9GAMM|nr:dTDP-4-dehydrorhamnose reductase [Acidihalobacter yilgarnensis]AOU98660.1 dTDP-4-dehydrorhamnose reductase [Acidihalobacter yilgarnensis]
MKVLIAGADGQLGRALRASVPPDIEVTALTRAELDITDATAVRETARETAPDWIINAAAYTAVDRAEAEPDLAFAINADGPRHLATAAQAQGVRLVQVSTDFVFDGQCSRPYRPDDATAPLGVYGASKLAGEVAVRERLGADALIVRTAWVYAPLGNNFVRTMLRLMRERDQLGVVDDQVGTPTCASGLAVAIWSMIGVGLGGTHHWTDAGVASWYDFALAIRDEAFALGLLDRTIPIRPITTAEYPTPAQRPPYSVLDKHETWTALGGAAPHWREALHEVLRETAAARAAE